MAKRKFVKRPILCKKSERFNSRMLPGYDIPFKVIQLFNEVKSRVDREYGYCTSWGRYRNNYVITVYPSWDDMRKNTSGYKNCNYVSHLEIPVSEVSAEDLQDEYFFENTVSMFVDDLVNNNSGNVEEGPAW